MFEQGIQEGFMPADHYRLFKVASSVEEAVDYALASDTDVKVSNKL